MKKFILIAMVLLAVMSFTSCVSYDQVKKEHASNNYYPVHVQWGWIVFYLTLGVCGYFVATSSSPVIGGIMIAIVLMAFYTNYSAGGDYFVSWTEKHNVEKEKKTFDDKSLYDRIFWQ